MTKVRRAGVLAARSVAQFRRREVLTYLGLRYYLENAAARSDRWAAEVATGLVSRRRHGDYLEVQHYKELTAEGAPQHRTITLPGPNEALAEAALLAECARYPIAFGNASHVFSYRLSQSTNRSGSFEYYLEGLRERHRAIAAACEQSVGGVVRYVDMRRFYSSLGPDQVAEAWRRSCGRAEIGRKWHDLGEKLIGDYARQGADAGAGLLTGPMFSHLLANLVLRPVDERAEQLPARVFRYVDDLVLVGPAKAVGQSLSEIESVLRGLGVALHSEESEKCFEVTCAEWLRGRGDYDAGARISTWGKLVADTRRFLIVRPERTDDLRRVFNDLGVRLPLLDYRATAREAQYLDRLRALSAYRWFRQRVSRVSIKSLTTLVKEMRAEDEERIAVLAERAATATGYERKRIIPKLRLSVSRLLYVGDDEMLRTAARQLGQVRELHPLVAALKALVTRDVSEVLELGTNVAQVCAQAMRANGTAAFQGRSTTSEVAMQSLAVFEMNGVGVTTLEPQPDATADELRRFARLGVQRITGEGSRGFIGEMSALHGEGPARHAQILESAFEYDEALHVDALDLLHASGS